MVFEPGCFTAEAAMSPRARSISGAVMAFLTVPLIIGLLACLPVPIGDPERSSIDDEMTGLWMKLQKGEAPAAILLEPYDKRTWLVNLFPLEFDYENCDVSDFDRISHAEVMSVIREVGGSCMDYGEREAYKAWKTRLGDTWFMTWEPKGVFDEEYGYEPEFWLGFRLDKKGPQEFTLWMIDADSEVFEELEGNRSLDKLDEEGLPRNPATLKSARRALERVVRRHANNEAMYTDGKLAFYRIRPEDYELFAGHVIPDVEE
jgi:hypothetical protein